MNRAAALLALVCSCIVLSVAQPDDYALDFDYNPSNDGNIVNGYMSIPPMKFGGGSVYTFEFLVHPRAAGCILDMADTASAPAGYQNDPNRITIDVTTNALNVNIGGSTVSGTLSIVGNKWWQVSVIVNNDAGTVDGYLAGVASGSSVNHFMSKTITGKIGFAERISYAGACINRGGSFLTSFLNGQIDDLRIWAIARIPTEAGPTIDTVFLHYETPGLIVQFPLNDLGWRTTIGFPGPASDGTMQYMASLVRNGAQWILSKKSEGFRTCSAWGDPHWTDVHGNQFDTPHVPAYFMVQQCKNDAMTVKAKHVTGCCWGGATVVDEVVVEAWGMESVRYTASDARLYSTGNNVWTALSGSSGTLPLTGATWSASTNYFKIIVPGGGWVTVSNHGNWMTLALSISSECEDCNSRSVCYGTHDSRLGNLGDTNAYTQFYTMSECPHDDPSSSWNTWSSISSRTEDPCEEVTDPIFLAKIRKGCHDFAYDYVTGTYDSFKEAKCLFDACATGIWEPPCVGPNCDDCKLAELRALADSDAVITLPPYCIETCPEDCAGHGVCNDVDATCTCDTGYTGLDCKTPVSWNCFSASLSSTPGRDSNLYPYDLGADKNFPRTIDTVVPSDYTNWLKTYAPHVRDSILFLPTVQNFADGTSATTLMIIANHPSSRNGGSATLTFTPALSNVEILPSTCTNADKSTCVTPTSYAGSTLYLNWNPYSVSGAVVMNIAEATYRIDINAGYDGQILVGSALKSGKFDIRKFDSTTIYLTADTCYDDGCSMYDNCVECAADPDCGWCRDNNKCYRGTATGPITRDICANWRFTFDTTTSRRLTTSFGWPVNPEAEEVFLSDATSSDLPLELLIDIGDTETQPWDLIWVIPAKEDQNEGDFNTFGGFSWDIYSALTSRSVSWSMTKYGFGRQVSIVTHLSSSKPDYNDFRTTLAGMAKFDGSGNSAVFSALATIADPNVGMGWHPTAKRLALINVDLTYDTSIYSTDTMKNLLIDKNIIPVFAATDAVYSSYDYLVNTLWGYGLVLHLDANSANMPSVINQALTRVIGNIFLIFPSTGYIDTIPAGERNIFGLTSNMRARIQIPLTPAVDHNVVKTALVTVPGYGTASFQNVPSEYPWTTGSPDLHTFEDYTNVIYGYSGGLIYLTGSAYKNLPAEVAVWLTTLPVNGTLYTFTDQENAQGTAITAVYPDPASLVTDPLGRMIYVPDANRYAPVDEPLDYVGYMVDDLCVKSPETLVPIYVIGVNDPPVVKISPPFGDEDTAMIITLDSTDVEGDPIYYVIDELPNNPAEETDKTLTGLFGHLYQYDAAAPGNMGAEITTVGTAVTDITGRQSRVVYMPPLNANSKGLPPLLYIKPTMSFYAQESDCCHDYPDVVRSSASMTFPLWVEPVNDNPFVWIDGVYTLAQYAPLEGICYQSCSYKEDFGYRHGIIYEPATVYVGGHDIELSDLTIEVTAVSCPGTTLTTLTGETVVVGTKVTGVKVDQLTPGFLFKPEVDANGVGYCVVTYKTYDGELYSVNSWTITIDVESVNDLPRLLSKALTTYEDIALDFTLEVEDVENNQIQATVMSCTKNAGVLTYNGVEIDCTSPTTVMYSATSPVSFALNYVPPLHRSALQMMTIELELTDLEPTNPAIKKADHYFVTIDVLAINNGPTVCQILADTPCTMTETIELAYSIEPKQVLGLAFDVDDIDSAANLMFVEMTSDFGKVTVNVPNGLARQVQEWTDTTYGVTFKAPLAIVKKLLRGVSFQAEEDGTANIVISINDQGFVGACPPVDGVPGARYCPLKAQITLVVEVDTPQNVNAAVVGGVAAGGAVLGLAAAAVLFKLFRSPANPSEYHPWSMDGSGDGATENPLYKAADNSGSNPLYNMGGSST